MSMLFSSIDYNALKSFDNKSKNRNYLLYFS